MKVCVLFPDGEQVIGVDATDALSRMLGGWNPDTMSELRNVLAQRACIPTKRDDESDLEFLYRLDAATLLCVQITTDDLTPSA